MRQDEKRKAVILGSTKGLGKEISNHYRENGWMTVDIGSTASGAVSDDSISLKCDLASLASTKDLIEALTIISGIERFYWVAGRMLRGNYLENCFDDVIQTIDVNFRNAALISQCVFREMAKSNDPTKFVAIASSAGRKAKAGEAVYVATKFAQVGLLRSLGLENDSQTMHISLILPGGMKTTLWERYPTDDYETFLDPRSVAVQVVNYVEHSEEAYQELEVPRASLG